jgi:hypothetical protein
MRPSYGSSSLDYLRKNVDLNALLNLSAYSDMPSFFEPVRNGLHGGHQRSRRGMTELSTTALDSLYQRVHDSTSPDGMRRRNRVARSQELEARRRRRPASLEPRSFRQRLFQITQPRRLSCRIPPD